MSAARKWSADIPPASREAMEARSRWIAKARPEQLTPDGDWGVWLLLAGRGWGKTKTGAEDVAWFGQCNPGSRIAVIAPTYADARDTCVEGESGLLSVIPRESVQTWNRSMGELVLENATRFKLFGTDEPDRLRGPQHHRAWCDELGSWRYAEVWDQMLFGLRLGSDPRVVVTTTPKPIALVKSLARHPRTIVTRGSTFDNAANLAPAALAQLREKYEGTRLGRQELSAEILEEADGALWNREMLERARVPRDKVPQMRRVVIGVDPAVSSRSDSNLTGIVAAGIGWDNRGYVLADSSGQFSPDGWAKKVVEQYRSLNADRIVAEGNQGGDMVRHTIQSVMHSAPVTIVHASRGKQARAEPIAALYEQGKIRHCEAFVNLEDQMCTWEPLGDMPSPDRLDALVWALTSLFISAPAKPQFGSY